MQFTVSRLDWLLIALIRYFNSNSLLGLKCLMSEE